MGSLGDRTAVAIVLCTGSQEDWARRLDEGVVHAEAVHSLHPSRPHVCQDAAPASTFAYLQILAGGGLSCTPPDCNAVGEAEVPTHATKLMQIILETGAEALWARCRCWHVWGQLLLLYGA